MVFDLGGTHLCLSAYQQWSRVCAPIYQTPVNVMPIDRAQVTLLVCGRASLCSCVLLLSCWERSTSLAMLSLSSKSLPQKMNVQFEKHKNYFTQVKS